MVGSGTLATICVVCLIDQRCTPLIRELLQQVALHAQGLEDRSGIAEPRRFDQGGQPATADRVHALGESCYGGFGQGYSAGPLKSNPGRIDLLLQWGALGRHQVHQHQLTTWPQCPRQGCQKGELGAVIGQ